MKKFFSLMVVLFCAFCSFAQSIHYSENFYKGNDEGFYSTKVGKDEFFVFLKEEKILLDTYSSVEFFPNYIIDLLDDYDKDILANYNYIKILNSSFIISNKRKYGRAYHYIGEVPENLIIVANSKKIWYKDLTFTDKFLIHEMAHALTCYKIGEGDHTDEWAEEVKNIVSHIFSNYNDIEKCVNDIIKEYQLK